MSLMSKLPIDILYGIVNIIRTTHTEGYILVILLAYQLVKFLGLFVSLNKRPNADSVKKRAFPSAPPVAKYETG